MTKEEFRVEVLKAAEDDIRAMVNLYLYFMSSTGKCFTAGALRVIADELDSRNCEIEKQLVFFDFPGMGSEECNESL